MVFKLLEEIKSHEEIIKAINISKYHHLNLPFFTRFLKLGTKKN